MSVSQLAGSLIVAGSVLFLFAPLRSRGLYQLEPAERLAWVRQHPSRVRLQNLVIGVGGLLVAFGYLIWSVDHAQATTEWLNALAAALWALAAVSLGVFFYQTTIDPESYYTADRISWVGNLYFFLASAGLAAYGALFLEAATPDWIGWVSIGVAGLMVVAFVVIGGKDLPPQPYYLVALTTGVLFLIEAGI